MLGLVPCKKRKTSLPLSSLHFELSLSLWEGCKPGSLHQKSTMLAPNLEFTAYSLSFCIWNRVFYRRNIFNFDEVQFISFLLQIVLFVSSLRIHGEALDPLELRIWHSDFSFLSFFSSQNLQLIVYFHVFVDWFFYNYIIPISVSGNFLCSEVYLIVVQPLLPSFNISNTYMIYIYPFTFYLPILLYLKWFLWSTRNSCAMFINPICQFPFLIGKLDYIYCYYWWVCHFVFVCSFWFSFFCFPFHVLLWVTWMLFYNSILI